MMPCPDCSKPETPPNLSPVSPVSRQLAKAATERTTVPDEKWAQRLAEDSVAAGECETPLPFDDEDRMLLGTPLASMHHFKDGKVERMPMSTPPNPEAATHPSGCYCDTCTLRNLAEKNPEATVCDHGVARPAVCRVCLFGIKAEAAPVCANCNGGTFRWKGIRYECTTCGSGAKATR